MESGLNVNFALRFSQFENSPKLEVLAEFPLYKFEVQILNCQQKAHWSYCELTSWLTTSESLAKARLVLFI